MIRLKHPISGFIKKAPTGFSWTNLIFSWFVPAFRGDLKWCILFFIMAFPTFGLIALISPFIYNKIYIKELLEKGFVPADKESKDYLIKNHLIIDQKEEQYNKLVEGAI